MKSSVTNQTITTHPMSAESVNFKNGMIVTADDLSTAMHYPIALMQSVNKAVYGCGVICGFELNPDPELCGKTGHCDPCVDDSPTAYPNFIVQVGRGTALDCYGMPIELCKPVRVDVSPTTCGCDEKGGIVCLFIRRVSANEAPRSDCCAPSDSPVDCSRERDHVLIKAFPLGQEPEHACMRAMDSTVDDGKCDEQSSPPDSSSVVDNNPSHEQIQSTLCECLLKCDDCECCGQGWVLLGCIELCQGGILESSMDPNKLYRRRKWIKAIECLCKPKNKKFFAQENDGRNKSAEMVVPEDDKLVKVMMSKDSDIEAKIEKIVSSQAHRKLFKSQEIRNMEHFMYVLQERKDDLRELIQFSQAPEKIDEYLLSAQELQKSQHQSQD